MIIGLPRLARDHARATGANVFRDSLLGCGVDIQAGQIYSYVHRRTVLQSARIGFHGVPRSFLGRDGEQTLRWVQRLTNHTLLIPRTVNTFHFIRILMGHCPPARHPHPTTEHPAGFPCFPETCKPLFF